MKNKKYLVSLFVVLALLCLGIGYAAVSKELVISGNASMTETDPDPSDGTTADDITNEELKKNFKIHFVKNVDFQGTCSGDDTATVTGTTAGDLTADITVTGLNIRNSVATITFTVKNDSEDLKALFKEVKIVNGNDEYFKVTTDWDAATDIAPVTIAARAALNITVTIEVIKSATVAQNATFTITLPAEAQVQ